MRKKEKKENKKEKIKRENKKEKIRENTQRLHLFHKNEKIERKSIKTIFLKQVHTVYR